MSDMFDGIPGAFWANIGWAGVALAAVVAVFRGWLVPGKSLDTMLALHKERLEQETARGNEWKAAAIAERHRADERDKQFEKMFEVVNTTVTLMETLNRTAERAAIRIAEGR